MKPASTTLLILLAFSSLGLWGCTNQKTGVTNTKVRELEARYHKLEEDYRVVVAASETSRKKLVQLERERGELQQQIADLKIVAQERDNLIAERDNLRAAVATRTSERDSLQGQLVQFSKDLQGLVGRVEAAALSVPGSTVVAIPTSRSSE